MDQPTEPGRKQRAPWTVIVLIAIWSVTQAVALFAEQPPDLPWTVTIVIAEVLQFVFRFLIIVVIAHGLLGRSRFVWIVALIWQATLAGFGIVNFSLYPYSAADVFRLGTVPFFTIALPVVIAAVSFVLLLLPSTRRWIAGGQSLGSSRSVV